MCVINVADDVGAPQFVKRPKDQRVVEGNAAFFSCDVTSEPPLPHIHWTKDGKQFSQYCAKYSIVNHW